MGRRVVVHRRRRTDLGEGWPRSVSPLDSRRVSRPGPPSQPRWTKLHEPIALHARSEAGRLYRVGVGGHGLGRPEYRRLDVARKIVNAREFKREVLRVFYQDIHRIESNNYSYQRFSYDGVDRSALFDIGKHTMFMDWFTENYEGVASAWLKLADDASRDLYIDLIRFRIAGHLHVRIRTRAHELAAVAERAKSEFKGSPSSHSLSGMFGNVVHYSGTWNGIPYEADTVPDGLAYALAY